MSFPFTAECVATDKRNHLELEERVRVIQMAGEDYCEHDMYVNISWQDKILAIPLAQIKPINADEDSVEAISDWHYWIKQGYTF
jgi:hypothetical protein